jgi:alpha-1,3/alpha-1,6-mannosyltransferase
MSNVLHKMSDKQIKSIGNAGKERVKKEFSDTKMAERLDGIVDAMVGKERRSIQEIISFFLTILAINLDYAYYIALGHSGPTRTVGSGKGKLHSPPGGLTVGCIICWLGYFGISIFEKRKVRQEALARDRNR